MIESPLKDYGFEYQFEGKTYSFTLRASSKEEAERRALAIKDAQCVGELVEEEIPQPGDVSSDRRERG